ncbi:MAG: UdgX family uracil-DNA binding protein [Desulfovibrionales bacterium]
MPAENTNRVERLEQLKKEAAGCRRCDLWKNATQTVFGQGPVNARIMLVGEKPGDQEDRQGHPFVGPAGRILDKGLAESGLRRENAYVTNAVKHFKWVPRGARRQHRSPDTNEIKACRYWLEREIDLIRPKLIIAMGTTAARSVFGKATPINKNRGRFFPFADDMYAAVTVHPSSLLRIPDREDRHKKFAMFVQDFARCEEFLAREMETV